MKPETHTAPEPTALPQPVEPDAGKHTLAEGEQLPKKPHRIADMPALQNNWFVQELRRELADNRRREAEEDAG